MVLLHFSSSPVPPDSFTSPPIFALKKKLYNILFFQLPKFIKNYDCRNQMTLNFFLYHTKCNYAFRFMYYINMVLSCLVTLQSRLQLVGNTTSIPCLYQRERVGFQGRFLLPYCISAKLSLSACLTHTSGAPTRALRTLYTYLLLVGTIHYLLRLYKREVQTGAAYRNLPKYNEFMNKGEGLFHRDLNRSAFAQPPRVFYLSFQLSRSNPRIQRTVRCSLDKKKIQFKGHVRYNEDIATFSLKTKIADSNLTFPISQRQLFKAQRKVKQKINQFLLSLRLETRVKICATMRKAFYINSSSFHLLFLLFFVSCSITYS